MSQQTPRTDAVNKLKAQILSEAANGNICFFELPWNLAIVKIDDFVDQPADGILYDLNRLEEISLTFLDDPKWVNDYAVTLTIRKLVDQRDTARAALAKEKK